MRNGAAAGRGLPRFTKESLSPGAPPCRIGDGEIGGKAHGLVFVRAIVESQFGAAAVPDIDVDIPSPIILTTDVFDAFMERNRLLDVALSDVPDQRIAHAFQHADLPTEILGDLRAITDTLRTPLAIRSSSLLEDALFRPFAGVYETKMTPNNQPDASTRFQRLAEAIKFVYASMFFRAAKDYVRSTDHTTTDEKMAVVMQQVVGGRHGDRFYPELSGVAHSFNFYPSGDAGRDEGVVALALGLGKTIVDGGRSYSYSPARPKAPPPFASPKDLMANTQNRFWAVNVGKPPPFDPIAETEYLLECSLSDADYDGALTHVASTYLASSDRVSPGVGADGPRVLTFAPLLVLEDYPFNRVVRALLDACAEAVGRDVEIEFAMTFPADGGSRPRFGLLQVRPMIVSDEQVELSPSELTAPNVVIASELVMGNGTARDIRDILYVNPTTFEARHTRTIAGQLGKMNSRLLAEDRPYLLIGFGRWGSSDPWLGTPVKWGEICGARTIVEATRPDMWVEASQGSHFFHNISSSGVSYFSVGHDMTPGIDWTWLEAQPAAAETDLVRHVRLDQPLLVKVDGRTGRGVITHGEPQ
ncbi:MAG: PEP/pyruvate-binding domain-containing protein [Gemmatimonadota bacterium]|nr:PEP/pyruvate-binding domain-containing protein [Gemmatimonadota bacterium]